MSEPPKKFNIYVYVYLQEFELKSCLESLVVSLLSSYRFSPVTPDFTFQQMYLSLTLAILRHEASRKYLLKHVLYPSPAATHDGELIGSFTIS